VSSVPNFVNLTFKLDQREHPEHEELSVNVNGSSHNRPMSTKDLFIKDAFLVFRAMCKLTMKPLNTERHAHSSTSASSP
jgi:hypothetical protein